MRRRRKLELILVLQNGSRLLVPAKWTDLEGHAEPPATAGTLGSLDDLLAARRVLDGVLRAALADPSGLVERGDLTGEHRSDAAASRSGRVPSAGGGAVGASTDLELHAQHHIGVDSSSVVHSICATSRRTSAGSSAEAATRWSRGCWCRRTAAARPRVPRGRRWRSRPSLLSTSASTGWLAASLLAV